MTERGDRIGIALPTTERQINSDNIIPTESNTTLPPANLLFAHRSGGLSDREQKRRAYRIGERYQTALENTTTILNLDIEDLGRADMLK